MTYLLLIRHGKTQAPAHQLTGRMPGVHLDREGTRQAQDLADDLAELCIAAVYSSPMERARETAEPLAQRHHIDTQISSGLNEVDFGDWTGRSFEALERVPDWQHFNTVRSCTRIPGGEHFVEVQARVVRALESIRARRPTEVVAAVTHADIIRVALAHCAGLPIDLFLRLEIDPGSVSAIEICAHGPRLLCVNRRRSLTL